MGAKKLIYQISTALVVLLFTFAGLVKLVPGISPEIHNEMIEKFRAYIRVPPIDLLRLSPSGYMVMVGGTELVCVGLLLFGRYRIRMLSTWALLVLMFGALYTHIYLGDTLQDMGGSIAGIGFLLTRLYCMGALNDRIKLD